MEPVRAHGFVPVTRHLVDAAAVVGSACAGIGCSGVDGGESRQYPWPVVVIELIGPEVCAGKAVVLCAVVGIVLVRGEGESPKTTIVGDVRGQRIVVAEEHWLSVAHLRQLGRKGAVEGPDPVGVLRGETGVELRREA